MITEKLKNRLTADLSSLGLPVGEVNLVIRPYSSTYYGNYFPKYDKEGKPRIYIYPFRDRGGRMYEYSFVVDTFIHEMCHHLQHTDPRWIRVEGVMHDPEFWRLYNKYIFRAKLTGVIRNGYKGKAA